MRALSSPPWAVLYLPLFGHSAEDQVGEDRRGRAAPLRIIASYVRQLLWTTLYFSAAVGRKADDRRR